MWECVARSNPQASKSGAFDPDIYLFISSKGSILLQFTVIYSSRERDHVTDIRHFAETAQEAIGQIAVRVGVPITGDAQTDAEHVANAILSFYKSLGMKPLRETLQEKGCLDDEQTFIEKMIPVVMDDFKSHQWLPPIHTGDYREKVGRVCSAIYEEK